MATIIIIALLVILVLYVIRTQRAFVVLEEKMNDVSIATNSVKLQEVVKELTEISDKLDKLYELISAQ